jgi:hypothetical protein
MKLALLAAALLAGVVVATAPAATPRNCGTYSVGPGSLRHGNASGAGCLLRAYRTCHAATFTLSSFGVDTIARDVFHVVRASVICRVDVTASLEVVPQSPHRFSGTCRRVRRAAGDIVAGGCTGGLPATISLTGR